MRTLLFVVALAALTPPPHAYAGSDKAENCKEAADKKDLEGDDRRKFLRKCSSVGSQRVESCRDVATWIRFMTNSPSAAPLRRLFLPIFSRVGAAYTTGARICHLFVFCRVRSR